MSRNENAPEKSNFTRRCSLLSRYLKENGSFGNIDLGLLPKPDSDLLLAAKSDLPEKQNAMKKTEHSESKDPDFNQRFSKGETSTSSGGKVKDADLSETEPGSSQLTIFFGGKVIVYNEFPANKANEIMQVAKQTKPVTLTVKYIETQINVENIINNNKTNMVLPDLNEPTNSAETHLNHPTKQQQQQQQEQNQLVERIARRASLHRFFAKRKDRAVARAPYQVNQNAGHHRYPPKPETVGGQPLEPGQSSQRPDNAVAQTVTHPKSDGDKDSMEIVEDQSSKDRTKAIIVKFAQYIFRN